MLKEYQRYKKTMGGNRRKGQQKQYKRIAENKGACIRNLGGIVNRLANNVRGYKNRETGQKSEH